MARIGDYHHSNFIPGTPNYGFLNTEEISASGESINASAYYGPQLTRKNNKSITNLQTRPKVDASSLHTNANRRAFFEDEYHFVTGRFQPSGWDDVKYFGSGTLASDEVSGLLKPSDSEKLIMGPATLHGYGVEGDENSWDWRTGYMIDTYFDWLRDNKDASQSKYPGENEITIGNNIFKVDENSGRMVDVWIAKPTDEYSNADGVVCCMPDLSMNYGAQSYGDYQIVETLNSFWDFLSRVILPDTGDRVKTDPVENEGVYYLSSFYFDPPFPMTYMNPLPSVNAKVYSQTGGTPAAANYYPEHLQDQYQQTGGMGFYSKVETSGNSGNIKCGMYPVEFAGEYKGGTATSANAYTPVPYWNASGIVENTSSVAMYWDSNGPGTGFTDTPINSTERGAVRLNNTFNTGYRLYLEKQINHKGVDGVHRELYGTYMSKAFDTNNYRNSDMYLKSNDQKQSEAAKEKVFEKIQYWHERAQLYASVGQTYNAIIGGNSDGRMNEMYIYSPENKKKIKISGLPVHEIEFSGGGKITGTSAIEEGLYFSALPPKQSWTAFRSNIKIIYNYLGDNNEETDEQSNFMSVSQYISSGTDSRIKLTSKFEGYHDPGSIYGASPSEHWLGSRKICVIHERNEDAPGNLSSVAMGRYFVLSPDKGSIGRVRDNWAYPTDVISEMSNYAVSGNPLLSDNADARSTKFSREFWEASEERTEDPFGQKLQFGVPYSITYASTNGCPFKPKGWIVYQNLLIVGTSADDVINKLENYLSLHPFQEVLNPKDELPDSVFRTDHINKGGRVY